MTTVSVTGWGANVVGGSVGGVGGGGGAVVRGAGGGRDDVGEVGAAGRVDATGTVVEVVVVVVGRVVVVVVGGVVVVVVDATVEVVDTALVDDALSRATAEALQPVNATNASTGSSRLLTPPCCSISSAS